MGREDQKKRLSFVVPTCCLFIGFGEKYRNSEKNIEYDNNFLNQIRQTGWGWPPGSYGAQWCSGGFIPGGGGGKKLAPVRIGCPAHELGGGGCEDTGVGNSGSQGPGGGGYCGNENCKKK